MTVRSSLESSFWRSQGIRKSRGGVSRSRDPGPEIEVCSTYRSVRREEWNKFVVCYRRGTVSVVQEVVWSGPCRESTVGTVEPVKINGEQSWSRRGANFITLIIKKES